MTTNTQNIISRINKQFLSQVKSKTDIFFDSLKGVLFIFQQNSDDYKYSLNNIAIQKVIDNQEKIQKDLLSSINNAFTYFINGDYDFFINENLTIKNYHEVVTKPYEDDELAIVSMLIKKTDEKNDTYLNMLANMFSEMCQGRDLTIEQVPVSPFVVINSLVNNIKDIDLNAGIRMIIYNSFDVHVLSKLDTSYSELISVFKNRVFNLKAPTRKISKNKNTLDVKYTIVNRLYSKYHKLKQTLNNSEKIVSVEEIIQGLNLLQKKVLRKESFQKGYSPKPQDIKILLKKTIAKLSKSSNDVGFSIKEFDTIDFVELFFSYIGSDQSIPVVLKEPIMKLQISVLKSALQDASVFKYQTNSLRQLINQMAFVPEGFNDELSSDHKYVIKVNEVAAVIINQQSYNPKLYENLHDEINQYSHKMKKKFDLIQKRVKEKAVGLEKISQTKTKVVNILEDKMHDKLMPKFIRELLLKTWKNVLVLEFLRHPEYSETCQSKVEFIDLLLKCSQSRVSQLVTSEDVKEISVKFRQGLNLVAFNAKDLNDKTNELVGFLIKLHELEDQTDEITEINISHLDSQLILFTKKEVIENSQSLGHAHLNFGHIKVGTWLDMIDSSSQKIRAKISWVSPITGRYLLVTSNGVRLADMSPEEISIGIQQNKISELQIIPLFDRAMLEIAKQMNESML